MDVGTGKDLKSMERSLHLIDIVDPGYEFSVFEFQRRFVSLSSTFKAGSFHPVADGAIPGSSPKVYRFVKFPKPELRSELESFRRRAGRAQSNSIPSYIHTTCASGGMPGPLKSPNSRTIHRNNLPFPIFHHRFRNPLQGKCFAKGSPASRNGSPWE